MGAAGSVQPADDVDFYDVDLVYNDRGDMLRQVDNVLATTGGTHVWDRNFTLDTMGRLLGEDRGN